MGRASKILGILTDGADIGTCKISAHLVQWLLRNSHQKTVTTQLDLLRLNWIDCIPQRIFVDSLEKQE